MNTWNTKIWKYENMNIWTYEHMNILQVLTYEQEGKRQETEQRWNVFLFFLHCFWHEVFGDRAYLHGHLPPSPYTPLFLHTSLSTLLPCVGGQLLLYAICVLLFWFTRASFSFLARLIVLSFLYNMCMMSLPLSFLFLFKNPSGCLFQARYSLVTVYRTARTLSFLPSYLLDR